MVRSEPFETSGYHGAVIIVSATKGSAAIRQEVDQSSSALGLTHWKDEAAEFRFTIAADDVAARIKTLLEQSIELCRGDV